MVITEETYFPDITPIFSRVAHEPWAILLDSCHPAAPINANIKAENGRYDIIAIKPKITLQTFNGKTTIISNSSSPQKKVVKDNPFDVLRKYLPRLNVDSRYDFLPFSGGAIGYFSYDLASYLETLPATTKRDAALPEMSIGIYDTALVVDHQQQRSYFISADPSKTFASEFHSTSKELTDRNENFKLLQPFQSNMTPESYDKAFNKIKQYIHAGDCYQVNLTQRFHAMYRGSEWHAYKKLRANNPAPYAAFMNLPQTKLLSLSPEQFLLNDRLSVETKPIKGTRPRYPKNPALDQAMQQALLASEKDKAENLMIVDLLRNDIGKNCAYGSIHVSTLFALKTFANVHHLVSTIKDSLRPDKSAIDLMQGCFPGGSITGAPKIRAMEIIDELELNRREIYCGSIAYISNHGRMDSNITIRTCYTHENRIYCAAGGAIVADSEASCEYQESLDKISVMLKVLEFEFESV